MRTTLNHTYKSVKGADNPLYNPVSLMTFSQFKECEAIYKRRSGLTGCQLDVLSIMVNKYVLDGSGVTVNYVASKLNKLSRAECRSVLYKLSRMIKGGYVELLGVFKGYNIYVPTSKALNELSELVK